MNIPNVKLVLTDPTLFGNDAAEDEKEDIFYSYVLERRDFEQFYNVENQICISRAYKGEGKSALLRLIRNKINKSSGEIIDIAKNASELVPEVTRDDYSAWVKGWKASILSMFAVEIGTRIGVAWTDDAISLVEEAEKTGFKQKSLLFSILDRLKLPSVKYGGVELTAPERKMLGTVNPSEAVKRWTKGKVILWLFVDDVDKNFENTKNMKMKVASFFDACRELANKIPELRIRTAVRPNIWAIIRQEYESLSHVEQYVYDLEWSEDWMCQLLTKRIIGYLNRTSQWGKVYKNLSGSRENRNLQIISLAFVESMPWGAKGNTRPPYVILNTLSKHRPRWMIELAKVSAKGAVKRGHERITHEDIVGELSAFGNRRIQDTVAEFSSQCPQIDEIIAAFSREKEQLSTAELLNIIDKKILTHVTPTIVGISGRINNLNVAHLLYGIGFIYGRRDFPGGAYEHITFADKPGLLKARTAIDIGVSWEIHPVFRQILEIRDPSGKVYVRRRRSYY
jgi:hypothetical protein